MGIKVQPSRRLRQLVAQSPSSRQAAIGWQIEPFVLERFLNGDGGISGKTVAMLIEATGLDYDQLFEHTKS